MDASRSFVRDVKRVIVKVGTAVVTRSDGRLALGRLGALCEQLKELNSDGYELILVTSGAVSAGRQRLSFADLQKPQAELDGKACAAVGQNGLMALYDTLFSQLDLTSAQLLVTDNDFRDPNFRSQLTETVNQLLDLKVVPVLNENDAVSTRKAPYEDSSGIFWDNDSLAALLALELKADLLILLSDVDGLYNGPPSDPQSKLIHTYVKERHQGQITFGDKSRLGRGGMTAKVKAAVYAAYAGVPVIIARVPSAMIGVLILVFAPSTLPKLDISGKTTDGIIKVLEGQRIGTLFHKDAHSWAPVKEAGARSMAVAARESSRRLQALSSQERKKILLDIANALEANEELIKAENDADVTEAQISNLAKSIRVLAEMEEPIGRILQRTEVADGLILEKTSCPLGVLLVIFESRPDALVQVSGFIESCTASIQQRARDYTSLSNLEQPAVITSAMPEKVGEKLIGLVTSREEIPDLLKLDDVIDLVIPRGSNKLVSQIKESTKIPVLGHADGVCHVYVDKSANMGMAQRIVLDAKMDYPAACNAMETLLLHKDLIENGSFNELIAALTSEGVTLFGGPRISALQELNIPTTQTFHKEYSSPACTVEIIDNVCAAIEHINHHGSAHTDCIIAEDHNVVEAFLKQVDSTRFCDGARFGLGAEFATTLFKREWPLCIVNTSSNLRSDRLTKADEHYDSQGKWPSGRWRQRRSIYSQAPH
ncbi:hypothetical protein Cgig2_005732 [Carnegiea gigantea]|uniref:Delta-1-pyrroline-5-carboxylate synthase n=1 Tax=Carnegiea gigantea TaxID=171969 RepID=A0A9Q1KHZ2_9CARY|nr:hypothetical protein Cgig2_005732 [Carnegiea gigantea]